MPTMRREIRTLSFEIGDHTYEVPPVDDERGTALAALLTSTPDQLAKAKGTSRDLFKLAMSDQLWQRMRADGVPYTDMWLAGLACVAHFQVLLSDFNPASAVQRAEAAALAIWEAGISPEQLAAYMAAQQKTLSPTNRSTRRAAANTTRKPDSGTGTTKKKTTTRKAAASRSRGASSPGSGR